MFLSHSVREKFFFPPRTQVVSMDFPCPPTVLDLGVQPPTNARYILRIFAGNLFFMAKLLLFRVGPQTDTGSLFFEPL